MKYKNIKQLLGGRVFDSRREARRFEELKLLERAGKISDLRCQVPFELIPNQYERFPRYSEKTGKQLKDGVRLLEHKCVYIADFVYKQDGNTVVEDAKGVRTADYIIKRKLMLERHGIRIREV